jgi:tetratricopeptide (TPR) repeat protein
MPILEAENSFTKGLLALVDGDVGSATGWFASAIQAEQDRAATRPQMRYLSYWGLALALSGRALPEAVRACEVAAWTDSFNPDLELNLGKVYLLVGRKGKARAAFERGLELSPGHAGLRNELRRLEDRSPRVVPIEGRRAIGNTLRAGLSSLAQRIGALRHRASSF